MVRKKEKKSRYGVWMGCMLLALLTSVALFLAMLQMEKNMLESYERETVWVASSMIPEGQLLNDENWSRYMEQKELDKSCIPESVWTSRDMLGECRAECEIAAGTILTPGMFEKTISLLEGMEEPVIAGFKVEDLYQMVGGVLRAGDQIHIYSVDESGTASKIWEKLYVQQVFDNSGNTVTAQDQTTAVTRVNIYLDGKDVERFYSLLVAGSLRVVKVCEAGIGTEADSL